ncbi:MAG: hypothetical protein R3D67_03825 [Hyphomicrobiaceae bacterium]
MVFEIFERVIRGLGADHERLRVLQQKALPLQGLRPFEQLEGVQRQLVVRAPGMRGVENTE